MTSSEPLQSARGTVTVRTPPRSSAGVKRRQEHRQYKCAHCSKLFKRSEHCIRHERSHTNEKPYSCQYCHKSYARKDLVTRHERTLHADVVKDVTGDHSEDELSSEGTSSETEVNPPRVGGPRPPRKKRQRRTSAVSKTSLNSIVVATDLEDVIALEPTAPEDTDQRHDLSVAPASLSGQPANSHQVNSDLLEASIFDNQDLVSSFLDPSLLASMPPSVLPLPDENPNFEFLYSPNWFNLTFPLDPNLEQGAKHATRLGHAQQTAFTEASPNSTACDSEISETGFACRQHATQRKRGQRESEGFAVLDEARYASVCEDVARRLGMEKGMKHVPSLKMCQTLLSSYERSFHCHLPILHPGVLSQEKAPGALVLAICSIGALYRLDRRRARQLYDLAKLLIEPFQVSTYDLSLWVVQTKFLLTFYAIFSGDQDLVTTSINESGFYTLVYGRIRNTVSNTAAKRGNMTWSDWVERESWKRLLSSIYVAGTIRTVIYGVNPIFNASTDLDIESLHDESLWNARSSDEWLELRAMYQNQDRCTIRGILEDILTGARDSSRVSLAHSSPLCMLTVTHAILVHMWHLNQISQASPSYSFSHQTPLSQSLLQTALASLSTCCKLLHAQKERLEDADEREVLSIQFSSHAVLRAAFIRLFDITKPFDRLSLMAKDPAEIVASVDVFARAPLKRDHLLLDVVEKTLEGFHMPFRLGHMLIRKTAAFRWSIEHAVAAWDAGLFVTKWVHSVEMDALSGLQPTAAENELLLAMKEVLEEADYDPHEDRSFAAELARTWSLFLGDVWVWGITARMGKVLEQLAQAYDQHHEERRLMGM